MNRKCTLFFLLVLAIPLLSAGSKYKNSSVLATGNWYRMAVVNTGIHRITYQDLVQMGVDPGAINPAHIRLYGNGGGMLPELNEAFRVDDLRENPIQVVDGGDGRFDEGDYILFYGEGPDKWYFDNVTKLFYHQKNLFSDSTYYFFTADLGPGRRIGVQPSTAAPANSYSRRFDTYAFHDVDQRNLIKSGRTWYGEVFNNAQQTHAFSFTFPNLDSMSGIRLKTYVAARAPVTSRFAVSANGVPVDTIQVEYTEPDSYSVYAKLKIKQSLINRPGEDVEISLNYLLPVENAIGWLNYLELNCLRNLIWTSPQMAFRDVNSVSPTKITEFVMQGALPGLVIWEITDPENINSVEYALTDSVLKFRLATDTLREFIAFDGSLFHPVTFSGQVPNQNLHAADPANLTIVAYPAFFAQAQRLADFHHATNGISVNVVTTTDIFTEFGCGQADMTAIRDYMKMQYNKSSTVNRPKYLLLFGDGSYDPKNRIPGNNNLIPTFQSTESLKFIGSYVTDDYFGIMGDKEGQESNGTIDIGIGRFPVSDTMQARAVVDKIIHYSDVTPPVMADWRNVFTFVADDENDNLHLHQAEELTEIVAAKYPSYNISKIYLDAYQMVRIPAGMRFPDANKAINQAVRDGAVVLNYTGHGGESGWSYEQVLTTTDIEAWDNFDKLPVFVTATCEFSRFDNPERFSAGEMVILHPGGGAIALYSTTRLALATSNFRLDTSFFNHLMDRDENGEIVKMGDLIRISKNNNSNNNNIRNFTLLGDPAQSISFPHYNIRTTEINNEALNQDVTTLGMSTVTVKGQIEDLSGQKLGTFNGTLTPKVFDKPIIYMTLGNTDDSYPEAFSSQNSLLYTGTADVRDGEFEYSFVMPKSIALQFGAGKLSHYATNGVTDAGGYCNKIIIGGSDPAVTPANQGPQIGLYLDNRSFESGMKIGSNPVLISDIQDTNGINFIGLGIGHEILAVLDNDRAHAINLNEFFIPESNSYSRGSLSYGMQKLAPGPHTLSLKAWDMFDNSSEKEISFYVSESQLTVQHVMNSPNPLFTETWFIFEPMQNTGGLDIQIRIFDLSGRPVQTLSASFPEYLTEIPRIRWDGTGMGGQKLTSGIYPYEVTFRGKNGSYSQTSQKLVIMR